MPSEYRPDHPRRRERSGREILATVHHRCPMPPSAVARRMRPVSRPREGSRRSPYQHPLPPVRRAIGLPDRHVFFYLPQPFCLPVIARLSIGITVSTPLIRGPLHHARRVSCP